jgi:hypothetical protein
MPSSHAYSIPGTDQTKNGTLTLMQLITGATRRLWITEWSVSGKSVNAADVSVRVEWVRQTDVGVGSAAISASVIGKIFEGEPAMIATAREGFTTEPAGGTEIVAGPWYISPVAGLYTLQIPLGEEIQMAVSSWLGLRMVSPQSTTMRANVRVRE